MSAQPTQGGLLVATDGSCLKNPGGPTGWAWVAADGRWSSAGCPTGTNQVGELRAVLSALRDFSAESLTIETDSEYALNVATKWAKGWERRGWRTKDGSPVKNLALVQVIRHLLAVRTEPVRFVKVPGHDPGRRFPLNDQADAHARAAAIWAQRNGTEGEFTGQAGERVL